MAETKKTAETTAEHEKRVQEYYNEKVPVFIHRPESEPEESVTVTLNGTNYQIRYDEEVMVPRRIALIVEESLKNKRIADDAFRRIAGNHHIGEVN